MQWFPDLASSPDRKVCGYLANKVTDANAQEELRSLAKVPPTVCHEAKRLHKVMVVTVVGRLLEDETCLLRIVQIIEGSVIVVCVFNHHIMHCDFIMICD